MCTAEYNNKVRKYREASKSNMNVQLMMHHTVELININFLTGGLYYCIQICVTKFWIQGVCALLSSYSNYTFVWVLSQLAITDNDVAYTYSSETMPKADRCLG